MRYRDFLGRKTSVLCMGSVGLGFDFSQKQTNEILDAYVNLGGNFIDTARVYGDFAGGVCGVSERAIGNWLAARHNREKMILGTKGGHPETSHHERGTAGPGESFRRTFAGVWTI